MVVTESLVVRAVTRFVDVEQGDHQPRSGVVATDAARGLNIFGGEHGLTDDQHQAEALNVEADRDHVGGQGAVNPVIPAVKGRFEPTAGLGDLVGRHPRGQFEDGAESGAIRKEAADFANPHACPVAFDGVLYLFFQNTPRTAQLTQVVEVAQDGHVRIGGVGFIPITARVEVGSLRGSHQGQPGFAHDDFRAAPLRRDADILAGRRLVARSRAGKERVAPVGAERGEEMGQGTTEQRLDLSLGAAHGGG